MKMIFRKVLVSRTRKEVLQVIDSIAYPFPKKSIGEESFSIYCRNRTAARNAISAALVRGNIVQRGMDTEVTLWIPAGFFFYVGSLLILGGAIGALWLLVAGSLRWVTGIVASLCGLFICAVCIWNGNAILNRIERELVT